jgi:hypothetical protein
LATGIDRRTRLQRRQSRTAARHIIGLWWTIQTCEEPSRRRRGCPEALRRNRLGQAAARRFGPALSWRWKEKVAGHAETGTQPLHHRYTQRLLAAVDFTDMLVDMEHLDHVGTREAVLIHEVADQIGPARWSAGHLRTAVDDAGPARRMRGTVGEHSISSSTRR